MPQYRSIAVALLIVSIGSSVAYAQTTTGGAGEDGDLRQELMELVRSRAAGLSNAELRRLIAAIGQADLALPEAAKEVLDSLRKQETEILRPAYRKIAAQRRKAVADLKEIQGALLKSGKLDEAIAVRNAVQALTTGDITVLLDPGTIRNYAGGKRVAYFRVTGGIRGTIWGTRVYTADSNLATAAVHAGVLRVGQTGVVKVTLLPSQPSYVGSARNGVTSNSYGTYASSYRVEELGPLELEMQTAKKAGGRKKGKP